MTTTTKSILDTPLQAHLTSIDACMDARQWAGKRTAKRTWKTCQRPDWLLWWAARTPANTHANLVLAACDCVRAVLHLIPEGEERPRLAIEAAERWSGDPSKENRQAAGEAAWAAWAAARAAWAAARAAWAAARAAGAAGAAWAEWAAEREKANKDLCILIRKRLVQPWNG